jgi:hypothetical protein
VPCAVSERAAEGVGAAAGVGAGCRGWCGMISQEGDFVASVAERLSFRAAAADEMDRRRK